MKPFLHWPRWYFVGPAILANLIAFGFLIFTGSTRAGWFAIGITLLLYSIEHFFNRPPDDQDKWQ